LIDPAAASPSLKDADVLLGGSMSTNKSGCNTSTVWRLFGEHTYPLLGASYLARWVLAAFWTVARGKKSCKVVAGTCENCALRGKASTAAHGHTTGGRCWQPHFAALATWRLHGVGDAMRDKVQACLGRSKAPAHAGGHRGEEGEAVDDEHPPTLWSLLVMAEGERAIYCRGRVSVQRCRQVP
jgi:hypothetical protein